ncbi:unnamed protein product [Sphagnum balticum]
MSGAAAVAAALYWRNAGITYISYANTCAAMVRNCLKEPHKIKTLNREQVYYKLQIYQEGEPHKADVFPYSFEALLNMGYATGDVHWCCSHSVAVNAFGLLLMLLVF